MTYPIFLCRGIALPSNDVDGALSEENHIPFGAVSPAEAAAEWVRAQVHPVHGSLSVFIVEAIPHTPGGVDGEAVSFAVQRFSDGEITALTYSPQVADEMLANAKENRRQRVTAFLKVLGPPPTGFLAAIDVPDMAEADALTSSALADAHEGDDDEV